ncbi:MULTISPECIES: thioesterase II family protein [Burkholderia]|uniref:Thioesterase n=1 Tax=Burkholderia paludis TaxID=1506587 RepID=A0A6J5DLL5_9BURK|nr:MULTISPECIES: alpha/beta fold hydrolase [Burkholderia]CAB3754988.1 Linear gramicidin dehydrogenase LgrE [Burkholderia paludis]VWB33924.1 thioesterase [Burkholderia paludis]
MTAERATLFCLPFAGGSSAVFNPWRALAPAGVHVAPLAVPGRGAQWREPLLSQWAPLVDRLLDQVAPHVFSRYALFGHSMGALLAFELAHRLRACGLPAPALVVVSACRPPRSAHRLSGVDWLHCPEQRVLDELTSIDAPDDALAHDELRALMLPIVRNDFQLCANYRYVPRTPLATPIHALAGSRDAGCPFDAMRDGWRAETLGSFSGDELDGGHLYLRDDPARTFLAVCDALDAHVPTAQRSPI